MIDADGALIPGHIRRSRRITAWSVALAIALSAAWIGLRYGPFFSLALISGFALIIGLLKFPWVGVLLLVASVPAQEFGAVQVGAQSLTLTRAMFPVAVAGYVISLIIRRDALAGSRVIIPYAFLLGTMLASLVWANATDAAAAEIGRWLIAFVSFVIALHFLIDASQRRIIVFISTMAIAGVFEATFGVTQSFLALGPESFRVGTAGSRAFGTFGQPNSYAGYLEMVVFPVLWTGIFVVSRFHAALSSYRLASLKGMAASRADRTHLLIHLILAVGLLSSSGIILGGIVASYSRGAWFGVATGLVVSAVLYHRWIRRVLALLAPLGVLVVLGGIPAFIPVSVSDRVTTGFADIRPFDASTIPITDENFAAAERMAHWQAGWSMFEDHPMTGVGAGNFNERYPDYFVRDEFRFTRGHAHNFYIHLLAEVGLAGLAAYLALLGALGALALTVLLRAPDGIERMLALGAFGTIVSVGVHNVFENLHVLNLSIQLGLIWALVIVAYTRWTKSNRSTTLETPL